MKKLVVFAVLLGLLVSFPFHAKAEGIEAGQHMWALSIGGAGALQKSGMKGTDLPYGLTDQEEMEWGKGGAVFGFSYLIFPSEYFGIGLEANDGFFGGEDYKYSKAGKDYKVDTGMNVFNAMVSMRANLNPQSRFRFYIPFGAGYTWSTSLFVSEETVGGYSKDEKYHASSGSLGYFGGFGFEIDLGDHWSLGGEGRYNGFTYDTDKIAKKYGGDKLVGKKDYSYISVVFKASYRF